MTDLFKKDWFRESAYPTDFIPEGGQAFVSMDLANGVDCTVKGFFKDGVWHIQEVECSPFCPVGEK